NVAVAGQLVWEGAHVAGTLDIVLPTQRVHAHPFAAHVAGDHGQVGNGHDGGRTLRVLSNAQAIVDRRIGPVGGQMGGRAVAAPGGVETRRRPQLVRVDAGIGRRGFRRVFRLPD